MYDQAQQQVGMIQDVNLATLFNMQILTNVQYNIEFSPSFCNEFQRLGDLLSMSARKLCPLVLQ